MAKIIKCSGAIEYIPKRGRLLDDEQRAADAHRVAITLGNPQPMFHRVEEEIGDEASTKGADFSRQML